MSGEPRPVSNTDDVIDSREVLERNGHLLELTEDWRCLTCGHGFDAASDADRFACGESCVGKHPGDSVSRVTASGRVSTDPDGLDCYSDHEHDIDWVGVCEFCDSNSPGVVGHVLPDTERVRNLDPVAAARRVVAERQHLMVDGVLLDSWTAQYIVGIHDKLSPANQAKLRGMSLATAAAVCFKLASR